MRWYNKVFTELLLGRALVNAFIIFETVYGYNNRSIKEFLETIGFRDNIIPEYQKNNEKSQNWPQKLIKEIKKLEEDVSIVTRR